ncbi:MAG: zf-HC2 domain-containing protein [Candidatus Aminicenantales bacterium]
MECENVRTKLKAFVDGELEGAEQEAVRDHLDGCPECLRVAGQLEKLPGVLRAWKAGDPPEDLYARLQAKLELRKSWWRKVLTPAFAGKAALRFAEAAAIVLITLAVSGRFQKPVPAQTDDEIATINLYITEHQEAVMQAASEESAPRQGARVTLSREDVMYYEFIDDYRRISRPGLVLRGTTSGRDTEAAGRELGISKAKTLTLPQARKAVSFDPVSPSRIHPGYILDGIAKVAGRDSLHLLYTNGIDTFSVFEQPLGGQQGLAAKDFREYAVYRSSTPPEGPGNQAGTTILAWKNSHVSFALIGREDLSRLMAVAQAFSDRAKSVNEFEE